MAPPFGRAREYINFRYPNIKFQYNFIIRAGKGRGKARLFPKNVKENELGIDPEKCYAKCTKKDKRRSCLWIKYSMRVIYESKKKRLTGRRLCVRQGRFWWRKEASGPLMWKR